MRPATREPCPRGRPLFRCGRSHVSARVLGAAVTDTRCLPCSTGKGGRWDGVGGVGLGQRGEGWRGVVGVGDGGGGWGLGGGDAHMHTRDGFVCTMRCTCARMHAHACTWLCMHDALHMCPAHPHWLSMHRRACDGFVCSTYALHTCKGIHGPCFFWGWGMVGQGAHCVGVCERKRALSER